MPNGPTRSSSGPGNTGETPVQFRMADAQRIANVVGKVEGDRRGRMGSTLPRAAGGGGGVFTTKFAGSWTKGTEKILVIAGSTTAVVNLTHSILYQQRERVGFVSMIDARFVLLSSECD